jgi:cytochrome c
MKTASGLAAVLFLSLAFGCTQQTQPAETNQQVSESKVQASPTAAGGGGAAKSSGERGTPAEAKAMLEKAAEHYKSVGREQALADFNAKKPPFFDRDLYVACMDSKHVIVANGGYPQLVGTSADAWRDADGKAMGKAVSDATSSNGEGSVEYRWYNPVSGKIEPKVGFVQKIGDDILLVGAYNPK